MSFQMVLLRMGQQGVYYRRFGTMSFQMVLLPDLLHSEYSTPFWNYVIPDGSTTECPPVHAQGRFWNYVIPDGSTTRSHAVRSIRSFWNYVIPDGSTTSRLLAPP